MNLDGALPEPPGRPRLAIVGINYRPECTGIGVYTSDMAEFLAGYGFEVTVYTGFPYYPAWQKADLGALWRRERIEGVTVRRHYVYVPARPSALRRMLHELSFIASASLGYLLGPRAACTVIVSPPLFLGIPIALIAWLKGSTTLFHVQDLQPDAAVELGMLKPGRLTRLFYALERLTYRLVDRVGSISRGMERRIVSKGVPAAKMILTRNWASDDRIEPQPSSTDYRRAWGLEGRFVVLYAGNLGIKQGLEFLLEAAGHLRGRSDIAFVIVGDGGERPALERRARDLGLANVRFEPLQPVERLGELLASADLSVIPQRRGVGDIVLPSKLCNILASSRPVVVAADEGTELAGIVRSAECGLVVPPGDGAALAEAIVTIAGMGAQGHEWGGNGRRYMLAHLSRQAILEDFAKELHELCSPLGATASRSVSG